MRTKVFPDAGAALSGLLRDEMTIAVGGFGLSGIPETLIDAVLASGATRLTFISNNAGVDDYGLGLLIREKRVKRMISSYVGENREFERQYLAGELEIEFNPQGTLAERIRAGGAGIPAFYTRTGVGTALASGKEIRQFGGEDFVMETGLVADLALVKAWQADEFGNLVYRKSARNFNPVVATCSRMTLAEAEQIVPTGAIASDHVHTPGVFVKRLILARRNEKRIERRTVRPAKELP